MILFLFIYLDLKNKVLKKNKGMKNLYLIIKKIREEEVRIKQLDKLNRNSGKKIIISAVAVAVVGGLIGVMRPWEKMPESKKMSIQELKMKSGSECIEILEQYGLVLPDVYRSDTELAERSVKEIVDGIDEKGGRADVFAFNYVELNELAKRIYEIVEKNMV